MGSNKRSISNSRPSNLQFYSSNNDSENSRDDDSRSGERTMFVRRKQFGENEFRSSNENRRIGSGRIPVRDS